MEKTFDMSSAHLGLFLHYNVATFTNREWANGHEEFSPQMIPADPAQWAQVADTMGAQYAVLTVKHTGGWMLRRGIILGFVEEFRRRGIAVGFYYCMPGDYNNQFGNHLEPGQTKYYGIRTDNEAEIMGVVDDHLSYLLETFGTIDILWVDQRARMIDEDDWVDAWIPLIRRYQPGITIIENGASRPRVTDVESYELPLFSHIPPSVGHNMALEYSDRISRSWWFWRRRTQYRTPQEIAANMRFAFESGANYLLNVPPDTTGRIPRDAQHVLYEAVLMAKR